VIVEDGIRRMYIEREDCFYYLTVGNEPYVQPPMPDGVEEGILRGLYKVSAAASDGRPRVHLFGSGAILNEALRAQGLLAERGVAADVWSVTSYLELRRDALAAVRHNTLHPLDEPRVPYIAQVLASEPWPVIAASDYMKIVADQLAPFVPNGLHALGTDGFGRSETREALRRFFEVDAESICVAALHQLAQRGQVLPAQVQDAIDAFGIDPEKPDPAQS
jgi:pyruvate dehydrogenase E1 component